MDIKEYQVKQNEFRRPVLVTKDVHEVQKVCDISSSFDSPSVIADMLDEMFDVSHLVEEYVWMLCTDAAYVINGVFEISHGSVNRSLFSSREIIQKALLAGAVNIVLAHCHPSGNPTPSDMDIVVTKNLYDACKLMNIPLRDHIIVGCDTSKDYYSFLEEDVMSNW